jgi:hypothetical protein
MPEPITITSQWSWELAVVLGGLGLMLVVTGEGYLLRP